MPSAGRQPVSRSRLIATSTAVVVVLLLGGSIVVATRSDRLHSSSGTDQSGVDRSAPAAAPAPETSPGSRTPAPVRIVHRPVPVSLTNELSTPGTGTAVIDIRQAEHLINDLIPIRDRAQVDGDAVTLRQLETGAALAADLSNCGCPSPTTNAARGGIAQAISLVPRQTHYPASFFTEVLLFAPDGHHYREFVVMTRDGAGQPWKVALDTVNEFSGAEAATHPGAFDASDFNVLPQKLHIEPATLLALLAQQWQHQKDSGAGITGSPFAADEGLDRAVYRQDTVNVNGLRGHFTFGVDPRDPVYEFGLDKGAAFVCGVISIDVVWTAGPDGAPYQDSHRANWGKTLAPGVYGRLAEHRIMQPCILLPAAPTALAEVFPGDEAYVLARGTPAQLTPVSG